MSKIDRTGTFLGVLTDYGISATKIRKDDDGNEKGGLAQFACNLLATAMWNPDTQVWDDWTDFNADIDGYLVLVGNDNTPLLNAEQLMTVTGWDGKSFAELNDMDLSDLTVQFRVEENTYNNKTTLQVSWIDKEDATPGGQIRKMDKKEIKGLDAKFKSALGILGGKTVAKAPASKPAVPPKSSDEKKEAPKRGRPKKEAPPTRTAPKNDNICTQEEAWQKIEDTCLENVTDKVKGEAWLKSIKEVVGDKDDEKITGNEWWEIADKTMSVTCPF